MGHPVEQNSRAVGVSYPYCLREREKKDRNDEEMNLRDDFK